MSLLLLFSPSSESCQLLLEMRCLELSGFTEHQSALRLSVRSKKTVLVSRKIVEEGNRISRTTAHCGIVLWDNLEPRGRTGLALPAKQTARANRACNPTLRSARRCSLSFMIACLVLANFFSTACRRCAFIASASLWNSPIWGDMSRPSCRWHCGDSYILLFPHGRDVLLSSCRSFCLGTVKPLHVRHSRGLLLQSSGAVPRLVALHQIPALKQTRSCRPEGVGKINPRKALGERKHFSSTHIYLVTTGHGLVCWNRTDV